MRFYVGITDDDWFSYLSGSGTADEVNFWQPSGGRQFRVLQPGQPFLFKLHSPKNYIVGGGFFSHFTILPVSFAWSTFTTKNGAQNEREMRTRIARYRRIQPSPFEDLCSIRRSHGGSHARGAKVWHAATCITPTRARFVPSARHRRLQEALRIHGLTRSARSRSGSHQTVRRRGTTLRNEWDSLSARCAHPL